MIFYRNRQFFPVGVIAIVLVAAMAFCFPATSAPLLDNDQVPGFTEARTLNVTNVSFANKTIPHEYQITQIPVRVEVKYEQTLAGVKGEMAQGPRTIGFSTTPDSLIVIIIVAVIVGLGIGYFFWQKRNDREKEK